MKNLLLVSSMAVLISSCANLNTLGRSTSFPAIPNKKVENDRQGTVVTTYSQPTLTSKGKAIHLDAQQRLVMVNSLGAYCAEPSPDALAAYAASLSAGVSKLGAGSASLSQALQSSAASIGLRTQSITLMRDNLYRLCEAYTNGRLTDKQAAILLNRSQDLTTGIVAIEQLTGAVIANQAILNQSSGGNSFASLLSNQKLLEQFEAENTTFKNDLAALNTQLATANTELGTLKAATPKDADQISAKENIIKDLENQIGVKKGDIARRDDIIATLKKEQDSTLTSASVNNSSSGSFSSASRPINISTEAAATAMMTTVAGSVEKIVDKIVNKNYADDLCVMLISAETPPDLAGQQVYYGCIERLKNYVRPSGATETSGTKAVTPDPKNSTDSQSLITGKISKNQTLEKGIKTFLANRTPPASFTDLLVNPDQEALRQEVIKKFNLQ